MEDWRGEVSDEREDQHHCNPILGSLEDQKEVSQMSGKRNMFSFRLAVLLVAVAALMTACRGTGQAPATAQPAPPARVAPTPTPSEFTLPIIVLTPTRSLVEDAAMEVVLAFARIDYRDREGWTARVKEVCTDEGWAFWANGLDEMWADIEAKETVTTKVEPRGVKVLKTWEDGRTYVEVHIHAEGHGKGGPFSQDLTYNFVLAPSKHGWRFAGLIPAGYVTTPEPTRPR